MPALDDALRQQHLARLRAAVPDGADDAVRAVAAPLIEELARLGAQLDALAQAQHAQALSRAEMLRIDPLRMIPPARLAAAQAAAPDPGHTFAIEAGDAAFTGFGWHPAERTDRGTLRWSGQARCASLLLPALGGGEVVLSLSLRAPFGLPLDLGACDLFLDGMPLTAAIVAEDGPGVIVEARATLPPATAEGRITLLLLGPRHPDPAPGPRRDPRLLGLGLAWARLERA